MKKYAQTINKRWNRFYFLTLSDEEMKQETIEKIKEECKDKKVTVLEEYFGECETTYGRFYKVLIDVE